MQDSQLQWRLQRGDPLFVDCTASKVFNQISFQQPATSRLHASRQQSTTFEVGGQLPDTSSSIHSFVTVNFDATSGSRASISGQCRANGEHASCTLNASKPGAFGMETEVRGRKHNMLLRRFLETKLQFGCLQSNKTHITSSAEVTAASLANQLKLTANASTDFRQRLILQTGLQWQPKQTAQATSAKQHRKHHPAETHSGSHSHANAYTAPQHSGPHSNATDATAPYHLSSHESASAHTASAKKHRRHGRAHSPSRSHFSANASAAPDHSRPRSNANAPTAAHHSRLPSDAMASTAARHSRPDSNATSPAAPLGSRQRSDANAPTAPHHSRLHSNADAPRASHRSRQRSRRRSNASPPAIPLDSKLQSNANAPTASHQSRPHSNAISIRAPQAQLCNALGASLNPASIIHLPQVDSPFLVYASKPSPAFAQGTAGKMHTRQQSEEDSHDGFPSGGPGDRFALQLKGAVKGNPAPNWQLACQKAFNSKLQLRAQCSAIVAGKLSLPNRWQLEARHKLTKGAVFSIRLQQDQQKQKAPQAVGSHRRSLQVEHKSRTSQVMCSCRQQAEGWQIGFKMKAKPRPAKGKVRSRGLFISVNGQLNLGATQGNKAFLKVEFGTPFGQ